MILEGKCVDFDAIEIISFGLLLHIKKELKLLLLILEEIGKNDLY
jgi:hypothetical protein